MTLRYKSMADLPPMHRQPLGTRHLVAIQPEKPRKYRNEPVVEDGQRFDSKLEAKCYQWLKLRQAAGEVKWFLRQVNFPLEGDVKYRCDFFAMMAWGAIQVIDATGMVTQVKKNKLKQVKARYGIDVILWRKP